MSRRSVEEARPWFRQAANDVRTAEAIHAGPSPLFPEDIGCHVAAMCAQAIEKSLKGYLFLNGAKPAFDHRPDGYLEALLSGDALLAYSDHRGALSRLFDAPTRSVVMRLLGLTPAGRSGANTEYPWTCASGHVAPIEADVFRDIRETRSWLNAARRVSHTLHKFWIAVDRATAI